MLKKLVNLKRRKRLFSILEAFTTRAGGIILYILIIDNVSTHSISKLP